MFDTRKPYTADPKRRTAAPPAHPLPAELARLDSLQTPFRHVANDWGFADMHGNVAEWTATRHTGKLRDKTDRWPEPITDVDEWKGGGTAVVRGGSWGDPADRCRSASRFGQSVSWEPESNVVVGGHRIGFRVACDVVFLP